MDYFSHTQFLSQVLLTRRKETIRFLPSVSMVLGYLPIFKLLFPIGKHWFLRIITYLCLLRNSWEVARCRKHWSSIMRELHALECTMHRVMMAGYVCDCSDFKWYPATNSRLKLLLLTSKTEVLQTSSAIEVDLYFWAKLKSYMKSFFLNLRKRVWKCEVYWKFGVIFTIET